MKKLLCLLVLMFCCLLGVRPAEAQRGGCDPWVKPVIVTKFTNAVTLVFTWLAL